MKNRYTSGSPATNGDGWLGASVKWLTSRGKLLVAQSARPQAQRVPECALECLEGLDVGLAVWNEQGQRVFWNPTNDRLKYAEAPNRELLQQGKAIAPQLQELAGGRWALVYQTRSAAGYRATARVEVTDLVRRKNDLEDRVQLLARESETDALTGLANRRHFDAFLSREWNRAARTQSPLSLLMVDIDHFKKYNDHYGHLAGDHCLQHIATTLQGCARRAADFAARFGGEEFVLLLPGVDIGEACDAAQQCLEHMRDAALPHAASPVAAFVTLSIGVASRMPDGTASATALINAADAAMYRAKSDGRARYEVASQQDWDIDDATPRTQPAAL